MAASAAVATFWVGRVRRGATAREHTVRIVTQDGRPPAGDDPVEEIPDPFALARDEADPLRSAGLITREAAPLPGGLGGRLGDYTVSVPVRPSKIIGVGRNYRAHAEELGNEVPTEPLVFFKPPSALLPHGSPVCLPSGYDRIDMEAEVVVVMGLQARAVDREDALRCVAGYTLGNDVSCRDLQKREPQWARAKGFDTFAPLGPFVRLTDAPLPVDAEICGFIDGERCQAAPLRAMLFDVPAIVAYISSFATLEPGDLIFTGTPAGVQRLIPGCTTSVHMQGYTLGELVNPVRRA